MEKKKNQNLINECKQVEEDSLYTAEIHYIIGHKLSLKAFLFKFIPALITVISVSSLLIGAPNWVNLITLFSGLITIINILLEPEKESKNHFSAAQNFTVLKHEARSLHETFKNFIDNKDFYHEVRRLRDKYNILVKMTPPTDDEKAWKIARENIKSGRHGADFRK
ncbi:MAG: SLATT domain-containing protein [Candidatus Pacebacteria bacterium]|nr:SLATT domain-containing protein [Candidatus Paceibacterota bacterium]